MKRIFSCFLDAYRRGRFATFAGRASREDFWYFVLGHILLNTVAVSLVALGSWFEWQNIANAALSIALDDPVEDAGTIMAVVFTACVAAYAVFLIVSIIPSLSLMVRRYHDVGLSGYVLAFLILAVSACFVFVVYRVWQLSAGIYDAFPEDPDTMLQTGFTTEVIVMYLAQFLGLVNLVILALPGKQGE